MAVLFISHSSRNSADARRLREGLLALRFSGVFVDNHSIALGEKWEPVLYERLRASHAVIALVTPSFTESMWCFAELTHARAQSCPILPVVFDGATLPDLLRDTQWRGVAGGGDVLDAVLVGLQELKIKPRDTFTPDPSRKPYPGMSAFDVADAPVYVGREEDVQAVRALLLEARTFTRPPRSIVMMGASGTGKSSLLRAGVLPHLHDDSGRWLTIGPIRPAQEPIARLKSSLTELLAASSRSTEGLESKLESTEGTALVLRLIAGDRAVVIAVDQLEELADSTDDQCRALRDWLQRVVHISDPCVLILATVRNDRVAAVSAVAPWLEHGQFKALAPLPEQDLLRTIMEPARRVGVDFEPALAQKILVDVRDRQALPLLAFTLRELWERRPPGKVLSRTAYTDDLRIEQAIRRAAENATAFLHDKPEEREALRVALLQLIEVSPDGASSKQRVPRGTLPPLANAGIEALINARLLVVDGKFIEPAHEALFDRWERLTHWVDEARNALIVRAEIEVDAHRWEKDSHDVTYLWAGDRLERAVKLLHASRLPLKATAEAFFTASHDAVARRKEAEKHEQNREIRRFRRIAIASAGITLMLVALTATSYAWFRRAQRNEEEALARQLSAQSDLVRHEPGNLMLSSLLAIESARRVSLYENRLALESTIALAGVPIFQRDDQHSGVVAGHSLATIGHDGAAYLWEPTTGREIARFEPQSTGQSLTPSFTRDGSFLLTTRPDGSRVWDVRNGRQIAHLSPAEELLAIGPALVILGPDGMVRVLDSATGQERARHSIPPPAAPPNTTEQPGHQIVASPDGKLIAVHGGSAVQILDARSGHLRRLLNHEARVTSVVIDDDGTRVLTVTDAQRVNVWEMSTGRLIRLEHESPIVALQTCEGSAQLISATEQNVVRLWDGATGRELQRVGKETLGESGSAAALSPDCSTVATVADGGVRLVDVPQGRLRSRFTHERDVMRLLFGSDSRLLLVEDEMQAHIHDATSGAQVSVVTQRDGRVHLAPNLDLMATSVIGHPILISDLRSGAIRARLDNSDPAVEVVFSQDAAAVVGQRGDVRVWDLATGRERTRIRHPYSPGVRRIHAGADGRWLLTSGDDHVVRVWDLQRFEEVRAFPHEGTDDVLFDVTADGKVLVTVAKGGVRIWEISTGREMPVPDVDSVEGVVLSPDSRWMAIVGISSVVGWDIGSARERFQIPRMGGSHPLIGADGSWLAMLGAIGQNISVFDAASGSVKFTVEVRTGTSVRLPRTIQSAIGSPDGRWVIAATTGDLVVVLDAATGQESLRLNHAPFSIPFLRDDFLHLHVNSTGTLLATAGSDRVVRVWDFKSGELNGTLEHLADIASLRFTPRGDIATVTDRTVHIWTVDQVAKTAREVARLEHRGNTSPLVLAAGREGDWLATSQVGHPGVLVWRSKNPRAHTRVPLGATVDDFQLSSDGTRLGTKAGQILQVWDVPAVRARDVFSAPAGETLESMLLSGDGKALVAQVASKETGTSVRIWDAETGILRARIPYAREIETMAFNSRSDWFTTLEVGGAVRILRAGDGADRVRQGVITDVEALTVSEDGIWTVTFDDATRPPSSLIRLVDVDTGDERRRLQAPSLVSRLAVSPDQRWLAAMELNGSGYLWNLSTGELVANPQASMFVEDLLFSPDSRWLAASVARGDPNVYVWGTPRGQLLATLSQPERPYIRFSPDGAWLMSRGDDNIIRVLDPANGREFTRVRFAPEPLFKAGTLARALAFLPDGRIVTANKNVVSFESWTADDVIRDACSRLTRPLDPSEWDRHLPGRDYRHTCANIPRR